MKKIVTYSLALLLPILFLASCSKKGDRPLFMLKGNVKSCEEKAYFIKNQANSMVKGELADDYTHTLTTFDKNGRSQGTKRFNGRGKLVSFAVPLRNDKGAIVGEDVYTKDSTLIFFKIRIVNDTLATIEEFNTSNELIMVGKNFMKDKKIVRQTYEYLDGSAMGDIHFTYNKQGLLSAIAYKNLNGMYYMKHEYVEFDSKKNWTKRIDSEGIIPDELSPIYIVERTIEYY